MLRSLFRAGLVLALIGMAVAVASQDAVARDPKPRGGETSFLVDLIAGDYVLVGRAPDGGAAYSGSARIEVRDTGLVMRRRIGDATYVAAGAVEVPDPPGEGEVLRFRWEQDGQSIVQSCLVDVDLDNYARLTCLWRVVGRDHPEPGLEALFPTASWPDTSPSTRNPLPPDAGSPS